MKAETPPHSRWYRQPRSAAVLAALLLAAGGLWWWQAGEAQAAKPVFTPVTTGDIEETVTAQGSLQPKTAVDVGTQVSGQVQKIFVSANDTVSAGTLLAQIDPTIYQSKVVSDQSQLKNLRAQLVQQQAQAELARQQHERNLLLVAQNAVSKQDADTTAAGLKVARAAVASSQAQVEGAEATLKGDQANLGYTKIYAPIDGTIISTTAREGQTVNASQQAPTIVQMANLDVMSAWAQVAEADIGRIQPGGEVYFTTLASTEHRWYGKVQQVLPAPDVVNNVVLYNVVVDVDNRDRQLMSGMSTQMFFVIGSAKNVPLLPVAALGKRVSDKDSAAGEAYMVRVKGAGGRVQPTLVHVGLMSRTDAEVKDGLKAGDEVATGAAAAGAARGAGARPGGGFAGGPRL